MATAKIRVGSNLSAGFKAPVNPAHPPKAVPGGQRVKPRLGQRDYSKKPAAEEFGPSQYPYGYGLTLRGHP